MKKKPLRKKIVISFAAALAVAGIGAQTSSPKKTEASPSFPEATGSAPHSPAPPVAAAENPFDAQVREDVLGVLTKNSASASLVEWREGGFTPEDLFKQVRDFNSKDALRSLCRALKQLPDGDLIVFEDELKNEMNPALSCAPALIQRVDAYWEGARGRLASLPVSPPVDSDAPLASEERAVDASAAPALTGTDSLYGLQAGEIALTFDEGPHPTRTPRILRALREAGVRAAFFTRGRNVRAWPQVASRCASEGHAVASCGWGPARLAALPVDQAEKEISAGRESAANAAGAALPFFRFSYGDVSAPLREFAEKQGLASFAWNMDSLDWKLRDPAALLKHLRAELDREKRGIVRFHDTLEQTAVVLPAFLAELKSRGYKTVAFRPMQALEGPAVEVASGAAGSETRQ